MVLFTVLGVGRSVRRMKVSQRLAELTRPTGEEDLLAVDYPEPRINVAPKQAAAAVGAVLVLVGGWFVVRDGPPEPEWESAEVAAPTGAPASVVVSVVGAVAQPGLVTLDEGARVADALEQARPLPEAELLSLNLAQVLADGQQIIVLAKGEAPPAAAGAAAGQSAGSSGISLNTASAQDLTELPGVGEATAAAIVAHRESIGTFTSVDQLLDVKGIGPAKFDAIKELVSL